MFDEFQGDRVGPRCCVSSLIESVSGGFLTYSHKMFSIFRLVSKIMHL